MAGMLESAPWPEVGESRVFFDAVLQPHRSLSHRGVMWVLAALGVPLLVLGTAFMAIGAWPVLGFCGLEFMLLCGAFAINRRDGRAYELVRLSDSGLEIRRIDPRGRVRGQWRLQPNWLRISMDDPPGHDSQLVLSSHGRSLVIGAFLTPEERLELARALRRAIDDWRVAPHPGTATP